MPDIKRSLVFTNDKCVGCHRCISECPIPGANVSVVRNDSRSIQVDGDKCIHCGHCLTVCGHGAREFADDTERFLEDLAAGEKISLAVSPSFYILYPEEAPHILGYLRSLGVGKIYNAAFGVDIMLWAYMEYIDRSGRDGLIASTCPSLINYLEQYRPDFLERLVPVQTPAACLSIYAEKYLGDSSRMAYISPCLAYRDEIQSQFMHMNVRYNVTFARLTARLKGKNISGFSAKADLTEHFSGGLLPIGNGLNLCMERYLPPDKIIMRIDNMLKRFEKLDDFESSYAKAGARPCLAEPVCCDYGCISGSGTALSVSSIGTAFKTAARLRLTDAQNSRRDESFAERRNALKLFFAKLHPEDFARSFTDRSRQPYTMPEDVYNEIFNAMHKESEQARHMNCGSCGHSTCREMALAIGFGYNKLADCVHYSQAETMRLYLTDDLTGIPNLVSFNRDVTKMLQEQVNGKYILGVLDIKGFKVINDLYGYEEGNRALRFVAERLTAFMKDKGYCARMYSDRFAFCMPNTEDNIRKLLAVSEKECAAYDLYYPLSLDFGFYRAEDNSVPVRLMLDLAQLAQRSVKGSFKMRYAFYDKKMRDSIIQEAEITAEMRGALQKGQFHVYLQPQYNHKTHTLVGAEALVRWVHPTKGIISPALFIPVFEKNSFITEVDKFVWEKACILLRKWIDNGSKLVPLSVNLSRLDLYAPDLVSTFTNLIKKYDLPAKLLKLEITESAYVENASQLIGVVSVLRQQGFIIEMDDFGSGYSSLNSLKDVPVDILKLDLKFIAGDSSGRGGNILQSIVRMARWLSLPVIAEGVESERQADYLASVGCEVVQGFYYSKPVPIQDFEKLMGRLGRGNISDSVKIKTWTNISELWDPDGPASLLLDTCFGGAGIFEYSNDRLEALRVNENFHQMLGLGSADGFNPNRDEIMGFIFEEDRGKCREMLKLCLDSGKTSECEVRCHIPDSEETEKTATLRIKARAIAQHNDCCIYFASMENVAG
jgi:EAL domain-containing protein (putative c-di-GMP-specific phosphodiesterase class I)/GGDEF domain-containing protein/NAD-dependent dihydropyrimidine dehydrogenase PreA subunit